MPLQYVIRAGDCIESLAFEHGHSPDTLWEHELNASLRELRENPDLLVPGDVLTIPDLRIKTVEVSTGAVHRFRRVGVPARFRVVLEHEGQPRAGVPFVIDVDGKRLEGTTDATGLVEVWIVPNASRLTLIVGEDQDEIYEYSLGKLLPVTERGGLIARLVNLGHLAEEDGDVTDERLADAIRSFQAVQGLEMTADADFATRAALVAEYGC